MAELVFPDGSKVSISAAQKAQCGRFAFNPEPEIESPIAREGWDAVQEALAGRYPESINSQEWTNLMSSAYALGCNGVLRYMCKFTSLSIVVDPELPEKKKLSVMRSKLAPLPDD